MTTVKDVLKYIEAIAPPYMKESWDRIGLNCGHMDATVTKVLVALDPFKEACQEAKDIGAELLVTHHALIWEQGFITDQTEQGRNTLFLIENHIAHINAHTNLDCAPDGVNDVLARTIGLKEIAIPYPAGADEEGREYGLLRSGIVEEQSLEKFMSHIKKVLNCPGLKYVSSGKPVRKVCVGGGGCGGELKSAAKAGCDTFITSDLRYNMYRDAYDLGINLIDAGHFHTENPVCEVIAKKLQEKFPDIQVVISEKHVDHGKFFI